MSKLLDPLACPDCRSLLDPSSVCTGCGLALIGPDASALWQHLISADRLIERLRLAPALAAAPAAPAPPIRTLDLPAAPPRASSTQPSAAPPRVSTFSAQVVLLAVGGLCLLVAAAVFVAVSWSDLGLGGRTLVMTAITLLVGGIAVALTRRGLRGGAETLWLLTGALVAIDVVAARWAGLIDDLAPRHVAALLGGILLLGSTAVAAWATTTATRRLSGPVLGAGLGALLLTATEAWAADRAEVATAITVPLLLGTAVLLGGSFAGRLRPLGYAVGTIGVLSWAILVGQGLDRTGIDAADWWQHLRGWPLLVAALWAAPWAAAPTAVRRIPEPVRYVAASAALLSLVAFTLGGTLDADPQTMLLSGVALSLAGVAAIAPRVWARPAAAMTLGAGLTAGLLTASRPLDVLLQLPTTGPAFALNLGEQLPRTTWEVASWTAPLIATVAVLTALSLIRHLPEAARAEARTAWLVGAPAVVALGLVTAVLEQGPTLLPAVLTWAALTAVAAALAVAGRNTPVALVGGLVVTAYLVAVGIRLAVPSHLLVGLFATLVAGVLSAAATRTRADRLDGVLEPFLAGAAVVLAGFAATHWPYLAHATGDTAALTLALLMAAVGLAAAPIGRTPATRVTLELTALLCALTAPFFANSDVVVALTLSVTGSAVALVSILNRDRDRLSWLAAALLAVATLYRLADGAVAPELYAVPAAAVLVTAGVWRLLRDEPVSSWRALGSGLTVGLVPSLLLTLEDPVSVRGALVAAAGVAALAVGIRQRWGAPFLAGAAVVGILAVRHLGPEAAALPRWISLGSVGVALLLVGITWEARRRDAVAAERYLADLR
ncbi:hypothetical protein EFK50_15890 [Nocardioides marmoriginsengisoli]|uniref:DUF2157 domain-containing protein n=1 Tax=Nocardioides marmoriginsengisoli TaxID=661483 RepID=A0A3N0CIA9_9ACTN|nr:hypothetical protein [Nocardioides marmoriginsengisoli]RNL63182.1 hypothetical protein EFK50_15890 [Nocardioides marmoriginsengisoli]